MLNSRSGKQFLIYNLARSTPLFLRGDLRCKHVVLFIFCTEFVIRWSDFRYSFASNVSYIRWKVLRIEFCLFHREKDISYGCVLELYEKKSIYTLPNRKLGKCNEIRNNRNLISGEVWRRNLKVIDKSRTPRHFLK